MTWIAEITGKLKNDFPLSHTLEAATEQEAREQADTYVEGVTEMLIPNSVMVTVAEKPRFQNHLFNDVADILHERFCEGVYDLPTAATIDQEAVDEAIRLHGEDPLWEAVSDLIDSVCEFITNSGALERAQEQGVQEGRLTL